MRTKLSLIILLQFFLSTNSFAYKVIEDVATKAGGYDIPIKIALPENAIGKMPVMFFVHGGGWNGGDENEVPGASLPADADYLCDQMGIIYVGLAYRCKGNNGTFHLALEDLEASIAWFEERADEFNADLSRIGFSGGSAGTTLSAVLAQRYPNCVVYLGREGMYNVLDLDPSLSNFPSAESRADFGLVTKEQKLEASPYHNLRNNPAASLLLHGKDDWLCHYSQSVKYAEQLKKAGGECKVILYDGINHQCLNIGYPDVFKNSLMEMARLFARGYEIKDVDFDAIQAKVDDKTKSLFPYDHIPDLKLPGNWESKKYGTIILNENGTGEYIDSKGKTTKSLSYLNHSSFFTVSIDGEKRDRTFYLRQNDYTIYELITDMDSRYRTRRNDFRKL